MSGLMQSTFQNLRKLPKIIPINLLVIGAGGGGASGRYYDFGGWGGNAGYKATVYNTSNVIATDFTYTTTVAAGTSGGYQYISWVSGSGNTVFTIAGGTGGASYISGVFRSNVGLNAPGGQGTSGAGGGSADAGLSTLSGSGVSSAITGSGVTYGYGASGGAARSYIGGSGAGASGSSPGSAGGGGAGGGIWSNNSYLGAPGGGGAAGIVIMRCRQDAYTTYTQSGADVNTVTISNIVYTLFTWNTGGSIIFT